ncbi:MAG: ATP-binding cassette domain-containing protein [Anaerolineales bacterium]|jgi:peptide/nickel transport system ATP-binding protein
MKQEPLLVGKDITVTFGHGPESFDAVHKVSIFADLGETVGIVGESGSGKTTLARVLVGLQKPARGSVWFEGIKILSAISKTKISREDRWKIQTVFQDPYSSLNPRMKAWEGVAEAVHVWDRKNKKEAKDHALWILNSVGISNEQAEHFPRSLSGGQRQRVSVARALAASPKVLIADEPTSSIDQSAQAQLLNLLRRIQEDCDLTIIFISHDLGIINYLTDRVYVMKKGEIVESGLTRKVFFQPEHPYTQLLINSIPGRPKTTTVTG